MIEKRIMLVLVVDKISCKICCSTKIIVVESLDSLGFKPQRIVKDAAFFMWDIVTHARRFGENFEFGSYHKDLIL